MQKKGNDKRFIYRHVDEDDLLKHLLKKKDQIKIIGCKKIHVMVFEKDQPIKVKQELCNCLLLNFKNGLIKILNGGKRKKRAAGNEDNVNEEYVSDEEEELKQHRMHNDIKN